MMPRPSRCGPEAVFRPEHIAHQLAEAVDHGRMIFEIGRRVDEAGRLHESLNRVEAAEVLAQRSPAC